MSDQKSLKIFLNKLVNNIFANRASVSMIQKIPLKSPKPVSHSNPMPFPRYRLKYRFLKIETCQIAFHRLTTVSRGAIISAVRHVQTGTYQVGPETRMRSNQVTSEFSEAILAFASVLGDHLPFGQSALNLKDDFTQHQNQKIYLPFSSKKKLFDLFCNENRALISQGKPALVSSSPVYSTFRKICVLPNIRSVLVFQRVVVLSRCGTCESYRFMIRQNLRIPEIANHYRDLFNQHHYHQMRQKLTYWQGIRESAMTYPTELYMTYINFHQISN